MAFSTRSLTLEQWLWCLFFGIGTLLWGQLVTTVPTRKIPKILSWGRGHPEEYTEAIVIGEEKFDSDSDKKPRAGQILWIRGLTRLQTQLRVIRAFKSTLEDLEERRSVHSLHSLHSLRSSRSHTGPWPPRPLSDITYIDEDPSATKLSPHPPKTERDDYAGNRLLSPHTLKLPPHNPQFAPSASAPANNSELLPKPVHETRI